MIGHLFLIDFITDPRLTKKAVFLNLMWMTKKTLFLGPEVWLRVRKVLGTLQRLSKDSHLF